MKQSEEGKAHMTCPAGHQTQKGSEEFDQATTSGDPFPRTRLRRVREEWFKLKARASAAG